MILGKILCCFIGHGKKYQYKIQAVDGKIYNVNTCHRCWKETMKEVK